MIPVLERTLAEVQQGFPVMDGEGMLGVLTQGNIGEPVPLQAVRRQSGASVSWTGDGTGR